MSPNLKLVHWSLHRCYLNKHGLVHPRFHYSYCLGVSHCVLSVHPFVPYLPLTWEQKALCEVTYITCNIHINFEVRSGAGQKIMIEILLLTMLCVCVCVCVSLAVINHWWPHHSVSTVLPVPSLPSPFRLFSSSLFTFSPAILHSLILIPWPCSHSRPGIFGLCFYICVSFTLQQELRNCLVGWPWLRSGP